MGIWNVESGTLDVNLEFDRKIADLKDQFQKKLISKQREEATNKEIKKLYIKKKEAETISLAALQKEKKLEKLLEEEEDQKEQNEIHELQVQLENEKKKTC